MLITLVGLSPAPCFALHALGCALEIQADLRVQVLEGLPGRRGSPATSGLLHLVLEGEPDQVVMHLDPAARPRLEALARRLRAARSDLPLLPLLPRPEDPPGAGWPAGERAVPALAGLLERLGRDDVPERGEAPWLPAAVESAGLVAGAHVHVGGLWAGQGSLPQARLSAGRAPTWPPAGDLVAAAQALAREGVQVRVSDPGLCADPAALGRLLDGFTPGAARHLTLDLAAELLAGLAERALDLGVHALHLDMTALADGALEPGDLLPVVTRLEAGGVEVRGTLLYGDEGQDLGGIAAALDGCLLAGLEHLHVRGRAASPGGQRPPRGWRFAPDPPHELLSSPTLDPQEMARLARVLATWSLTRRLLQGTGLCRVLARRRGGIFALLEELAGELALAGQDPLQGLAPDLHRQLTRLLCLRLGLEPRVTAAGTPLRRAPGLRLRWLQDGGRQVVDEDTGRAAHLGRGALRLLDHFSEPRGGQEAVQELAASAPMAQREGLAQDLRSSLSKLTSMSFLVPSEPEAGAGPPSESAFFSLDEYEYHLRMLGDRRRGEAYREAIQRAVIPGQHVVELGTGTGILAVWAAQAGARVSAIERFAVINLAREVVRESGVSDQVELIRGRADLVDLPTPGDLLVSEIVGNRILNEGLLEACIDARQRLLRPGATMIPCALDILVQLGRTRRYEELDRELDAMSRAYGAALGPLAGWFSRRLAAGQVIWEQGPEDPDFEPLSPATPVISLDLQTLESARFQREVSVVPDRQGQANAAMLAFRLHLLPGGPILSTCDPGHGLHWSRPVHMLGVPRRCVPGESVLLRVGYQTHGDLWVRV